MASYYKTLYNDLFKNSTGTAKTSTSNSSTSSLQNDIDNLNSRLQSEGVDTSSAKDSRNFIEKGLNLTEDQNFVFDIFELLGRPQQALFGAIDAAQKGEDVGESALAGFTGDKDTYAKDLLMNAGMSDRKGKLDVVDVLGFAGDVLLDPADLALIPATGGASVAAFAANKAGDVARVADSGKQLKSLSSVVFDTAGKAIKGTAKATDTGVEKWLKYLDSSKGVANADGVVSKITYNTPDAKKAANLGKTITGDAKNVTGRLETYKEVKDSIGRAFNNAANIPKNVLNTINKNSADSVRAGAELKQIYKELDDGIVNHARMVAKEMGDESVENVAKIASQVDKELLNLKEFKYYDRSNTMGEILEQAKNGKMSEKALTPEIQDKIKSIADDVNLADRGLKLDYTVSNGKVKLSKDWDYLINPSKKQYNKLVKDYGEDFAKSLDGLALDTSKLDEVVKKGTNYTDEDILEFQNLIAKYDDGSSVSESFKKLQNTSDDVFNRANKIVDKHFGTKMSEKFANNDGYVRHAFNKDAFDNYKDLGFVDEYGRVKVGGNTNVLSDRAWDMSVREANNMFKDTISKNADSLSPEQLKAVEKMDTLFTDGIMSSFDDYLKNVPKLAGDSKMIDEVLVKATFGNADELKSIDKQIKVANSEGNKELVKQLTDQKTQILDNSNMKLLTNKDPEIPSGFKQLSEKEVKDLNYKMRTIADQLGLEDMRDAAESLKLNGSNIAINKDLIRLIEVSTESKGTKGLLRLYDSALSQFKKFKVLSPTFQINNLIGNTANMYLGGISPTRQAELFPKAFDIMQNGENLLLKASTGAKLTVKEAADLDIWNKFIDAGFGNADNLSAMNLADMPDSLKKYFTGGKKLSNVKDFLVDGLPYLNNKMNNAMDTTARLVTFMEGVNNPSFLSKLGVEDAGAAVRKINFDPTDLTTFEKNTMKRIVPFYTFTKKNLAYQMSNLGQNGERYHRLIKGYDSMLDAATDGEGEDVQDWLKNNMYIPLPGLGENGEYKVLRGTIPFGQFIDTSSDPLGSMVNMLSPGIKAPIEMATNYNFFTGSPIEDFAGEKSTNIPFMTKDMEHLVSNFTGLDVPLKNISKLANGQGTDMVTMTRSIDDDKMSKMYDELDKLEELMAQYRQEGYEFATINELEKANKNNTTEQIMAQLNKYNGIKSNPYGY